ncbi:MAG TPA: cytochrome C [Candidatus Desulfofervidus auxilii]|uniref:Cytochrome C n=1 Tax=Desulfofervidus auxilii TaxID=1621989 RepID=A0A7V0IAB6_DESA2|nr:cytochrome C [Candidatus Desulfofervidus auxilii]
MQWTAARVGFLIGFLAVVGQALFKIIPPPAYGVCIACHMRDLINWVIFKIFPSFYGKFVGAPVSTKFPLLTIIGIVLGAFLAANINKEFKLKAMRVWWQNPKMEFLWGMLVCIGALIMGGCPVRTTLKAAYLDITAIVGLVSIFIGVILGCLIIRRLVKISI